MVFLLLVPPSNDKRLVAAKRRNNKINIVPLLSTKVKYVTSVVKSSTMTRLGNLDYICFIL